MDHRVERVALETDRYRISGDLTLPKEGYRSRISDYINIAELAFIPRLRLDGFVIAPASWRVPEGNKSPAMIRRWRRAAGVRDRH